jgi:hypothetical protein
VVQKSSKTFPSIERVRSSSPLDNDAERLERVLARPERVTVCFLDHPGVGKSALLIALAGGIRPPLPLSPAGPSRQRSQAVSFAREK